MQSTTARFGVLAAVVAVAVVLFIVLSGGNDDDNGGSDGTTATATTPKETTPGSGAEVLTFRDGKPVGGVKELTFNKGDQVNIEVRLDQPEEEVHVHGYEIEKPAQSSPVRLSFPASIDGVFEIEVHEEGGGDVQIAELRVNP